MADATETKEVEKEVEKAKVGELTQGTFSIKVKGDDDVVLFEDAASPFEWYKVAGLSQVFEALDAPLTDDQINFISEAFSSDAAKEVVAYLIDLHNDNEKAKAKANAYQKLMNLYKPASEEDKASAKDRAIKNLAKALGVTLEVATQMVANLKKE